MRGLILSGGKGSRLRPFTYSGAKQLVPVANVPILHFPIRQLVEAGITDIGIVVGDTHQQIRDHIGDGSRFGASVTYVHQPEPLGISHAVAISREFIGDEPFVLYLGDNVLRGGIVEFVQQFRERSPASSVVLKAVEDPRAFGVAVLEGGRITRVVEKPQEPPSNLAVIGIYAFKPAVFEVIARQQPSARGELEISDTLSALIAGGHTVEAAVTPDYWIDTGKMEDILDANRVLLEALPLVISARAGLHNTTIDGSVGIDDHATLENCTLRGPVAVGPRAHLRDCVVGPNVAIGGDSVVTGVTIRDAIVMENANLTDCPGIVHSMIGRHARVCGAPLGSRLTLGDHSCFEAGS